MIFSGELGRDEKEVSLHSDTGPLEQTSLGHLFMVQLKTFEIVEIQEIFTLRRASRQHNDINKVFPQDHLHYHRGIELLNGCPGPTNHCGLMV